MLSAKELLVKVGETELRARVVEQAGVATMFTLNADIAPGGDHGHVDSDGDTSAGGGHTHAEHRHRWGVEFKPGDHVIVGYLGGRTNLPVVLGRLV